MSNGLEKLMSFTIINKVAFIDSFSLRFSLDRLVKNLGKDNFKYLVQELNSDVLDLINQKEFHP